MKFPHKLDFGRIRHLDRLRNERSAVSQRYDERAQDIHKRILSKQSELQNAEGVLEHGQQQPETLYFNQVGGTYRPGHDSAIKESWSKKIEGLKRDIADLEGDLKDAQAEAETAGEEASAAIGLYDACKQFKFDVERAVAEEGVE